MLRQRPRYLAGAGQRTIAGDFLFNTLDRSRAPVDSLCDDSAEQASRPDQFIRCEQPPGLIAVDNAARDEFACHRTGVEAVAAKTARQPYAAFDFADLRHTMNRAPNVPLHKWANLDFAELRKRPPDIVGERSPNKARIGFPGAHAARPLQAVASDDAIMVVGTIGSR